MILFIFVKYFSFISIFIFDGYQTVTNVKMVTNVTKKSAVTNVKCMFSLNQHESLVTLAVRITDLYAIRFGAYHNLP